MSKANPTCVYDFTCKLDAASCVALKAFLTEIAKKWVFQKEGGTQAGYLHWQGRVSLKAKVRPNVALSLFNRALEKGWGHLSVTSAVCAAEMILLGQAFYVMKDKTRVEGPWSDKDEVAIEEPWHLKQFDRMLPWQESVVETLKVRDHRTINVLVDEKGNRGKSVLCGKIRVSKLGRILPPCNDWKDLMRIVCDAPTSTAYVIDVPRGFNQKKMDGMWTAIETVKNGYAYDDRYKFKEKIFGSPVIWVFMNEKPVTRMSADRWKIWKIDDDSKLQVY